MSPSALEDDCAIPLEGRPARQEHPLFAPPGVPAASSEPVPASIAALLERVMSANWW